MAALTLGCGVRTYDRHAAAQSADDSGSSVAGGGGTRAAALLKCLEVSSATEHFLLHFDELDEISRAS